MIATILSSGQAFAGDADVFVFLENNPLKGVEVLVNNNTVGTTDQAGGASTVITTSGKQTISITKDGEPLASTEFDLDATQDIEVSIILSTSVEPKINIYKTGDDLASAIGFLKGRVKTSSDEPLENALITIEGSSTEVFTNANGDFSFNLPRGDYNIAISHPDYANKTLSNVRVIANVGTSAIVKLAPKSSNALQLNIAAPAEEVLVLGRFNANQDKTLELEQMSTAVVDAIDLETIIRFGDTNVASVLKRVVGIAIEDDKYAVIRGLRGRYISASLNDSLMPTTNPFRRDAELDIYPSEILSGIEIQKSFSADTPADSSAGAIFIKTQGIPKDYKNKISASIAHNTSITGESFSRTRDGHGNYYGYDNGYRELPSSVYQASNGGLDFSVCQVAGQQNCISSDEAAYAATRLRNHWTPENESARNDVGLEYTLGNVFDIDAGSIGVLASVSFDKEYKSKVDAFLDNPLGNSGNYTEDTIETSLNSYLVAGIEFANGDEITSRTMLLRNTDDKSRSSVGVDNSEETNYTTVSVEWKEREIFAQQFTGHHFITESQELDWNISFFTTQTDVPDRRSYTYFGDFLSISTVERLWGELDEDGLNLRLDYTIPLEHTADWRSDFKLGALYDSKDRENEIVRLGVARPQIPLNQSIETLLNPQNFFSDNIRLRGTTTATDKYEAEQTVTALYYAGETRYTDTLSFIYGVRYEEFEQALLFPNRTNGNNAINPEKTDNFFPTLSVIFRPNENWQYRFAYSQTVSRPTLTEIAPTRFYDSNSDLKIGNPLLTESDINNLDFRMDYYFGDEGNISLALFHKNIENPVELGVADSSGSATAALTWRNEEEATVKGVELDVSTEIFSSGDHSAFIGGNLAFTSSEVTLTGDSARLQLDEKRDLQGQIPVMGNFQIGYDHLSSGQQITLLVNHFDDSIYKVTRAPEKLIYKVGRTTIDLNYEIPLLNESASAKIKIKNLTNEAVEFEQNGRIIEGWKEGTKISLSFSYNF